MKVKQLPDLQILRAALDYDPESGILRWRVRPNASPQWNAKWGGQAAGALNGGVRLYVKIGGHLYAAHRIAWKMVHGKDPLDLIDHVDGNGTNNRLSNLREATRLENQRNQARRKSSVWPKGVTVADGRFLARIQVCGRTIRLGRHDTPDAAHEAYVAAARELFGAFARVE